MSYINLVTKTLESVESVNSSTDYSLSKFYEYIQNKGYHYITASIAMQLYDKNSALADATDTIVKECKSIVPVIHNGKEYIYEHEVLDLLQRPNKMNDYGDFIESIIRRGMFITKIGLMANRVLR